MKNYLVITFHENGDTTEEVVYRMDRLYEILDEAKRNGTKISVYEIECVLDWA
jgi:hypothetical protein